MPFCFPTENGKALQVATNTVSRSRPGPIGPRPDVPTPPPSPRRSARYLIHESNQNDWDAGVCGLNTILTRWPSYAQRTVDPRSCLPLRLTTSSSDLRKRVDVDSQNKFYDDKLTDIPDIRRETRLHACNYLIAPMEVPDPHMSHLGSYKASESSSSSRSLQVGAGTLRNNPDRTQSSPARNLVEAGSDSFSASTGSSLSMVTTPAISDVSCQVASSKSTIKGRAGFQPIARLLRCV